MSFAIDFIIKGESINAPALIVVVIALAFLALGLACINEPKKVTKKVTVKN